MGDPSCGYGVVGGMSLFVNNCTKNYNIFAFPSIPSPEPSLHHHNDLRLQPAQPSSRTGAVLIGLVFVGLIVGLLSVKRDTMVRVIVVWAGVLAAICCSRPLLSHPDYGGGCLL